MINQQTNQYEAAWSTESTTTISAAVIGWFHWSICLVTLSTTIRYCQTWLTINYHHWPWINHCLFTTEYCQPWLSSLAIVNDHPPKQQNSNGTVSATIMWGQFLLSTAQHQEQLDIPSELTMVTNRVPSHLSIQSCWVINHPCRVNQLVETPWLDRYLSSSVNVTFTTASHAHEPAV